MHLMSKNRWIVEIYWQWSNISSKLNWTTLWKATSPHSITTNHRNKKGSWGSTLRFSHRLTTRSLAKSKAETTMISKSDLMQKDQEIRPMILHLTSMLWNWLQRMVQVTVTVYIGQNGYPTWIQSSRVQFTTSLAITHRSLLQVVLNHHQMRLNWCHRINLL